MDPTAATHASSKPASTGDGESLSEVARFATILEYFDELERAIDAKSAYSTLEISGIPCTEEDLDKLGRLLRRLPDLQSVRLSDIGLDNAALFTLCMHISKSPFLHHLDLSANSFTENGLKALAMTLPHCKSLTSLSLSDNNLCAQADLRRLSRCRALQNVNLSATRLGRAAAIDLAATIPFMKHLAHLNLSRNQIDHTGAVAIGHVLSRCSRLTVLDLSCNQIGSRGAQGFVKEVEAGEHIHLHKLDLCGNHIDGAGLKALLAFKVKHALIAIIFEPQHRSSAHHTGDTAHCGSSLSISTGGRPPASTHSGSTPNIHGAPLSEMIPPTVHTNPAQHVLHSDEQRSQSPSMDSIRTRRSPSPRARREHQHQVPVGRLATGRLGMQPSPLSERKTAGFTKSLQQPMFLSPLRNVIHSGTSIDMKSGRAGDALSSNAHSSHKHHASSRASSRRDRSPRQLSGGSRVLQDSPPALELISQRVETEHDTASPVQPTHEVAETKFTSAVDHGVTVTRQDSESMPAEAVIADDTESELDRQLSSSLMRSTSASVGNKLALLDKQPQLLVMEFFPSCDVEHHYLRRSALLSHIRLMVPETSNDVIRNIPRLSSRDIRKLDHTFVALSEFNIAVREHAILFNIDPFRAVILHDRCLLVVPDGADTMLSILLDRLTVPRPHLPHEKELPFEFRALETLSEAYLDQLSHEYTRTEVRALVILNSLRSTGVRPKDLELLRECKADVVEILSQATAVFDAMTLLLEEDADMFYMQLTKLQNNPALAESEDFEDHDEVETLLERFGRDVSRVRRQLNLLSKKIENTEELLALKQSTASNTLLSVDLAQSLFLVCLAFAGCVGAIFGMNLNSLVQEDDGWFQWVIIITSLAIAVFFSLGMLLFYKFDLLLH